MIRAGTIKTNPNISIVKELAAVALLDGDFGLGSVVATKAMKHAVQKAKKNGASAVSVRNTNDFGMAANYAMLALEYDCVGIVMTNTLPWVAPWGGRTRVLGTNPVCFAVPTGQNPIVLDASTSTVSHSKVQLCLEQGKEIPSHWALDSDGRPTTDPAAALEGALTPLGGYKGFGLGLIVDLLTGALAGMSCGRDVVEISLESKSTIGQLFMAIDLEGFGTVSDFKNRADALIRDPRSAPLAHGFQRITMPGELEQETEERRARLGIPIEERTWTDIEKLAEEIGLDLPSR